SKDDAKRRADIHGLACRARGNAVCEQGVIAGPRDHRSKTDAICPVGVQLFILAQTVFAPAGLFTCAIAPFVSHTIVQPECLS
ncbi:MAG: hypothetical protein ACI9LZ_004152, partial [Glaciecola sp.]